MKKEFTVSIKDDMREINPKPCYLTGEDKRSTLDIYNNFLESIKDEKDEKIIEYKLNTMASAIKNNVKRNQQCDEQEKEIVGLIIKLLENINVGESFTAKSMGKLDWHYECVHTFNTVVKRLIKEEILNEKRMAIKRSDNVYVKVYTRIK